MARDDSRPPDDPDREAILARRQRAIALAIAGLSATGACAKPQPCLTAIPSEPFDEVDEGDAAEDSFDDAAAPAGDAADGTEPAAVAEPEPAAEPEAS